MKDNLSIPLAVIFTGILIAGAILISPSNPTPALVVDAIPSRGQVGPDMGPDIPTEILALKSDDHVLGNQNAEVLIIEYSDTECPFCKQYQQTLLQIMQNLGSTGNVAWVYRHFPIAQLHPRAAHEAEALECANEQGGNTAFWKFTDKIYALTPSNNGLDPTQLPVIAADTGLNVNAFNTCLSSGKFAARIKRDLKDAIQMGGRGTPFTILWNKTSGKQIPIDGAYPYNNIKALLGLVIASKKVNTPPATNTTQQATSTPMNSAALKEMQGLLLRVNAAQTASDTSMN